MIIKKSNFMQNFYNANGSKDPALVKKVVLNEISNLIIRNPEDVIRALIDSDVDVPDQLNQKMLVDLLTGNLGTNKKLAKKITILLIKGNNAGYSRAEGVMGPPPPPEMKDEKKKIDWGKWKKSAGKLGSTVMSIFGSKSKSKADKAASAARQAESASERSRLQAEADLQRERTKSIQAKSKGDLERILAMSQQKKKGMSALAIGTWVVGGLAGAAILFFGIRYMVRGAKRGAPAPAPVPAPAAT